MSQERMALTDEVAIERLREGIRNIREQARVYQPLHGDYLSPGLKPTAACAIGCAALGSTGVGPSSVWNSESGYPGMRTFSVIRMDFEEALRFLPSCVHISAVDIGVFETTSTKRPVVTFVTRLNDAILECDPECDPRPFIADCIEAWLDEYVKEAWVRKVAR